jgi:hypothetical protein
MFAIHPPSKEISLAENGIETTTAPIEARR